MAYTFWNPERSSATGNHSLTTLYYEEDRKKVLAQSGAASAGLLHMIFRDEPVTVFAAKDKTGRVLEVVALPCPPYYHETMREAFPGKFLADNT